MGVLCERITSEKGGPFGGQVTPCSVPRGAEVIWTRPEADMLNHSGVYCTFHLMTFVPHMGLLQLSSHLNGEFAV